MESEKMENKMRKIRGLWKLLFGRTTILILMLLVQVVALVGGFVLLDKYVFIFNDCSTLL